MHPATQQQRAARQQRGVGVARWGLATMFVVSGTAHIVMPEPFERLVPSWVPGDPTVLNAFATVAELGSAALLSNRRTAPTGGLLALATLLAVWPANVQAAVDGGYAGVPGWLGSSAAAWVRVPLQVPLLYAAWVATGRRRP